MYDVNRFLFAFWDEQRRRKVVTLRPTNLFTHNWIIWGPACRYLGLFFYSCFDKNSYTLLIALKFWLKVFWYYEILLFWREFKKKYSNRYTLENDIFFLWDTGGPFLCPQPYCCEVVKFMQWNIFAHLCPRI